MAIPRELELSSETLIREVLHRIGEDPDREGLLNTPKRVVKSWNELFAGYKQNPQEILGTVFKDGACDEMVLLKEINFSSMCEHHMLPFIGKAHVAYLPRKRVVGLSKLARLVDCYAKRLQIQEKMTQEIGGAIWKYLKPHGVGVIIEAHHQCMSCRGVGKNGTVMVTSSLLGGFRKPEVRAEFFSLVKG